MGQRHKHADVIIAWANGEEIEFRNMDMDHWLPMNRANPVWHEYVEYRIKPKIVKREGWVNVYSDDHRIHGTREQADQVATENRIACVHIEWEEEA